MTLIQPPLAEPILQLLKNQLASLILAEISAATGQSLTEQFLMSRLGLKLTAETDLSPDLQRFQQHFVLYHLLYQLQTEWLANGEGYLSIGLARITLLTPDMATSNRLAQQNDNNGRRDYYSHWQNFYAMSEQLLDEHLQQFWQFYSKGKPADHPLTTELTAGQAQQLLQLAPGFSLAQLKKAYRSQALLFHPDRAAGNAATFIQIRQAYQQLLRQF